MKSWPLVVLAAVVAASSCGGCDDTASANNGTGAANAQTGVDGGLNGWQGTDGGPIQGGETVTVTNPDGSSWECVVTSCNDKILECGNCEDDDGDGLFDSRDRECLGPCDNTEGPALTAGVGGESGGPCKADCYFDFGNGSGNDDCEWDHQCDPLSVAPNYHPEGPECAFDQSMVGGKNCPGQQSDTCLDVCRPLTPNGCDCFGCCTFPELNGGYVWIGSMDDDKNGTCTFDDILDPSACEPCTPVEDCSNDCGRCELCIGKDEVPEDCFTEPTPGADMGDVPTNPGQCPDGEQACGLDGQPNCPSNFYCVSGCCQQVIN